MDLNQFVTKVEVRYANGSVEIFDRESQDKARELASHLERETRVTSISINGEPYLNCELNGLYLHRVGACSVCAGRVEGQCSECGGPTEDKNAEGGRVAGYLSVKPSHYHSREIGGAQGHEAIHATLCYGCHRVDRRNVYGEGYGEQAA